MRQSLEPHDEAYCPYFQRAIELIGGRWTASIVRALLSGHQRFSDLSGVIPGLSDRMLAERLRELESEGIVNRVVVPEMPVRIEYHLTEKGEALSGVLESVVQWLLDWTADPAAPLGISTSPDA